MKLFLKWQFRWIKFKIWQLKRKISKKRKRGDADMGLRLNGKSIIFICNVHSRVFRQGEWIKAPYLETAKEANKDKLNYIIRDCDICKEENKG